MKINDYKRGLTADEYAKVLNDCIGKVEGLNDLDWDEIVTKYNLGIHRDVLRKAFQSPMGGYSVYKYLQEEQINNVEDDETIKLMNDKIEELKKERYKLQATKIEYNRMLREQSRSELFNEGIENAIYNLKPLNNNIAIIDNTNTNKDAILFISDCHYGRKCTIKGLHGEIISEYNTEIFKDRMWDLLSQVVESCKERQLKHLNVMGLGDFIDGLLRISQLNSLQLGVVDSVIEFSEFMSEWLNELSKYVLVDYYQVNGNHDEIRVLTGKKGDFPHENVEKLIIKFIELRLKDNDNIKIHKSETDFIYVNILGVNVLGYHGENKNLTNSLRYFRSFYKQPIDLLFGGHLHSQSLETEGIGQYGDAQCIRVNGICGIDDYSTKLQKASRAGANMFIFKEGKGKVSQDDFWLN